MDRPDDFIIPLSSEGIFDEGLKCFLLAFGS